MTYTIFRDAPPNRRGWHTGQEEEHFPEGSVMLAFAMHLLELGADHVEVRPDGMHGKRFDFRQWFESEGFVFAPAGGRTSYVGAYSRRHQKISVVCEPGVGDVIATVRGRRTIAECKGGIINTHHPGELSHLRKSVLEAVGQLMCRDRRNDCHAAVVPSADETLKWARRIGARARDAGIEIALVSRDGAIEYATAATE